MVAVSSPSIQMQRLRARNTALTQQEAEDRVGSQMGVEEKVGRTRARGVERGKVVWNDGGKGDLEREVERVMQEVRGEGFGRWWGWWLWGSPVGVVGVAGWEVWRGWRARKGWEEAGRRERARL